MCKVDLLHCYLRNKALVLHVDQTANLHVDEGAALVYVCVRLAGMPYLDVVRSLRDHTTLPISVYHVSGEYAMLKAAAERGWLNEKDAALEALMCFRRWVTWQDWATATVEHIMSPGMLRRLRLSASGGCYLLLHALLTTSSHSYAQVPACRHELMGIAKDCTTSAASRIIAQVFLSEAGLAAGRCACS
jgi:hypothetical protein